MNKISRYIMVFFVIAVLPVSVEVNSNAFSVGGISTFDDDLFGVWSKAVESFVSIISSYAGWNEGYIYEYPNVYPYMWTEETVGGHDNIYADSSHISLIVGHGCTVQTNNGYTTALGFGVLRDCATPYNIRLGYQSPDGYGNLVWAFILQCDILRDDGNGVLGVSAWLQTLTGVHMVAGFVNEPNISTEDLSELAYRITGTGGYSKESIQNAFFHTFVKNDDIHRGNIARIVAENEYVADNDFIDSFDVYVPVDETKIVITCYIP